MPRLNLDRHHTPPLVPSPLTELDSTLARPNRGRTRATPWPTHRNHLLTPGPDRPDSQHHHQADSRARLSGAQSIPRRGANALLPARHLVPGSGASAGIRRWTHFFDLNHARLNQAATGGTMSRRAFPHHSGALFSAKRWLSEDG